MRKNIVLAFLFRSSENAFFSCYLSCVPSEERERIETVRRVNIETSHSIQFYSHEAENIAYVYSVHRAQVYVYIAYGITHLTYVYIYIASLDCMGYAKSKRKEGTKKHNKRGRRRKERIRRRRGKAGKGKKQHGNTFANSNL